MEAEINDLRAALVSEVKSAEKESERRAKEDEDIRRQLEVRYSARYPIDFPSTLSPYNDIIQTKHVGT